jgi:hypothetical protein
MYIVYTVAPVSKSPQSPGDPGNGLVFKSDSIRKSDKFLCHPSVCDSHPWVYFSRDLWCPFLILIHGSPLERTVNSVDLRHTWWRHFPYGDLTTQPYVRYTCGPVRYPCTQSYFRLTKVIKWHREKIFSRIFFKKKCTEKNKFVNRRPGKKTEKEYRNSWLNRTMSDTTWWTFPVNSQIPVS